MKHRIVSFEELVAPLSQGKVMVAVECLSFEACDNPEIMADLTEILNLEFGPDYDEWEDFLDFGFVVAESDLSTENRAKATLIIDFLRNEKFREAIQADLFIDGVLLDSSWNGDLKDWNSATDAPKPVKSVVIRFPVEKTNRRKDNGTQK